MIPAQQSILEQTQKSAEAVEPMALLILWADRGPEDALATARRMRGTGDVAAVADQNVTLNQAGELELAAGPAVALNTAQPAAAAALHCWWSARVIDQYIIKGGFLGLSPSYEHTGYARSIGRNDAPIQIPFTASGSRIYNSMRIQLGNATGALAVGAMGAAAGGSLFGAVVQAIGSLQSAARPYTSWVSIYFVDVATGKQVGNICKVGIRDKQPLGEQLVTGFSAAVRKGRKYLLVISPSRPQLSTLNAAPQQTNMFSVNLDVGGFANGAVDAGWRIPVGAGQSIMLGGYAGYQPGGQAWRTLDMLASGYATPPVDTGSISFSDVVPTGTAMRIIGYYTDSSVLAASAGIDGWTRFGPMTSGGTIPPARYWRINVVFTSNAQLDDSPRLVSVNITYNVAPVVLGTHAQAVALDNTGTKVVQAVKALSTVSTLNSSFEPRAKTTMIGKVTVQLSPDKVVQGLHGKKLRGRKAQLRIGYSNSPNTMWAYEGIVRDIAYPDSQRCDLSIQDPVEMADVSIPRERYPMWDAATAYIGGVIMSYGNDSYIALSNTTGQRPDLFQAVWQKQGTVWRDIIYPAGMHLADVAADILTNQVNVPAERIDLESLAAIKAALPNRIITKTRTINTQVKALDELSDIAWLLESYWVQREGRFTLLREPTADDWSVDVAAGKDIKEGMQYRRGGAELINEVLILTQYSGAGAGAEQYANGIGIVDATSVQDYGIAKVHEFKDKWALSEAELTAIATNFLNRWKDGRRFVKFNGAMRLLPIENGDVLGIKTDQFPLGDITEMEGVVIAKNINWLNQSIELTCMEKK